jgi:hypothetical protein
MLQKDENAYVRSSMDAARFVQGVVSFQSTAEHLSLLDDDRTWHQSVSEYGSHHEPPRRTNEHLLPSNDASHQSVSEYVRLNVPGNSVSSSQESSHYSDGGQFVRFTFSRHVWKSES